MPADWKSFIGIVAGIISFAAYIPYIISILRCKTRPHRITWWILSAVVAVTFGTYKSAGAENTLWVVVGDLGGTLSISVLSIRYGVGGRSQVDFLCATMAMVAMTLWIAFEAPVIGLVAILATDFLAIVPTIIKSYCHPTMEDRLSWTLTFMGDITSILAIERWVFAIVVYPVYHSLATGTILSLILRPVAQHNST